MLLSRRREANGEVVQDAYPSANNAGVGWTQIFDAMEAEMTSDELTNTTRAALVGMSIGIRLGLNRNLNGFPLEAALLSRRMK